MFACFLAPESWLGDIEYLKRSHREVERAQESYLRSLLSIARTLLMLLLLPHCQNIIISQHTTKPTIRPVSPA